MAWNPDPKVAAARDFAQKFGANRVVILYTTADDQMGYASYGETKSLCARTKRLADRIYEAAYKWFEQGNS